LLITKDEAALAHQLSARLRKDFNDVHVNVNPASHKFYPYWKKWFGEFTPIAQPQIDLLLVDRGYQLLAVELKYIRLDKKGQVNYPFYEGIGEALALLRFGFTRVSLWHCFDQEISLDMVRKYKDSTSSLINTLNLPINYSALRVMKSNEQMQFKEFLTDMSESERLSLPYGKSNPLHLKGDAKKIEDFLRTALKIPKE
jgi:hypothetical protein